MFYKKFSVKSQITLGGRETLRDRVLSLQFYLFGFLVVMSDRSINSLEGFSANQVTFLQSLKDNYRLTKTEAKYCHEKINTGIEAYHNSFMVHESGQKYIDLSLLKETLKDYKLSFRGDACNQEIKAVLMYLLDFAFYYSEQVQKHALSGDNEHARVATKPAIKLEFQQFLQASIRALGFSNALYHQLISMRLSPKQKNLLRERTCHLYPQEYILACQLLKVEENAEMSDIRRKFNRLMSEHHPDKLASLNLSETQLEHHSDLTHRYHKAFQYIKHYRTK